MTKFVPLPFRGADRARCDGAFGRIPAGERCRRGNPPIPIEDIVEKHLKLGIEFDDFSPPVR